MDVEQVLSLFWSEVYKEIRNKKSDRGYSVCRQRWKIVDIVEFDEREDTLGWGYP